MMFPSKHQDFAEFLRRLMVPVAVPWSDISEQQRCMWLDYADKVIERVLADYPTQSTVNYDAPPNSNTAATTPNPDAYSDAVALSAQLDALDDRIDDVVDNWLPRLEAVENFLSMMRTYLVSPTAV